jgi:hypothetical protein
VLFLGTSAAWSTESEVSVTEEAHLDNPWGRQGMIVPGVTAKITSNLTLWFEYTYWDAHHSAGDSVLENGYQMVVDWHS